MGQLERVAVKDILHYLQNRPAYFRPVPRVSYADRLIAHAAEKGVKFGHVRTHKKKK